MSDAWLWVLLYGDKVRSNSFKSLKGMIHCPRGSTGRRLDRAELEVTPLKKATKILKGQINVNRCCIHGVILSCSWGKNTSCAIAFLVFNLASFFVTRELKHEKYRLSHKTLLYITGDKMMTSNDTSGTSTPSMAQCDRWPALESDAEVYTALLHTLLSPSSTPSDTRTPSCPFFFQDVFSLDDDYLGFVHGETLALILAYDDRALNPSQESPPDPQLPIAPIFIKQLPVLDNACGTIALLHAIINTLPASTIPSSSLLAKFVSPIQAGETSFTSESLGIRLDAHEGIRAAHWCVP